MTFPPSPSIGSVPRILGAGLVVNSTIELATLDVAGMTLGTTVYIAETGLQAALEASSDALSSTVIAVLGVTDLRWNVRPVGSAYWAAFPFVAIDPVGGNDRNVGFGNSKAEALANGALKTFQGGYYPRIRGQRLTRQTVNLYASVPETDSTIPPPDIWASYRTDATPNGITIIGEPTVYGTVTLTSGTASFGATNNKSIVEATGLTGSWTSNNGQRLTSQYNVQGARFLRAHTGLKTAPILSDLGSKQASIGYPTTADTSLSFATGFRADPFASGDVCDVIGFPVVPDASPGDLPMSYQDVEFSNADRRTNVVHIISVGKIHLACVSNTTTMWFYGAQQVNWSGCLWDNPVKISSCPNVNITQQSALSDGLVTNIDMIVGSSVLGITDWVSQGAVAYFSNSTDVRAAGDAHVFGIDNGTVAPYIGVFTGDGTTSIVLAFSFVRGALGDMNWAVITNSMAQIRGPAAFNWLGTSTRDTQWAALAESSSGFETGVWSDLPFVGDDNHFGAYIGSGFA